MKGFPPVLDRRVTRLILGSFPSEASLAAGHYYAHPRNQFWRLLGDLFGEPLVEQPYEARLVRLLVHRVGLWDVLDACDRQGSLDASISNSRPNAFTRLQRCAPLLSDVAFNGGTAGRFAPVFRNAGYTTTVLPSSSPAHAGRTYEQKLAIWRAWWRPGPVE
ncbi:MAG: DNA-deoxyinosine glycosylase [Burkholderiaceae bacterium]